MYDNCAMENKHLHCVSCIVFDYKGQPIIADHFDSNNNDCRPCQYSVINELMLSQSPFAECHM